MDKRGAVIELFVAQPLHSGESIKMNVFQLFFIAVLATYVSAQHSIPTVFNMSSTWIAGSSATNGQVAVYGSLGVPASTNTPGWRYAACSVASNIGPDTMYLFGGQAQYLPGDFWSFDVSSAWWTAIHSDQQQYFGVQGAASNSTFPGYKNNHASVLSKPNQFFMFGGDREVGCI